MTDPDRRIRGEALAAIERLCHRHGARLDWMEIRRGFRFGGETVLFANQAKGIFKPRQMTGALSIKTVVPRSGHPEWYEDQHGEVRFDPVTGFLRYDLERGGPEKPMNRALWLAMQRRAPLIYFVGMEPGVYEPLFPVWVEAIRGEVALLSAAARPLPEVREPRADERERSYSKRTILTRNHQAWFSARTKAAYGYRCALSGLPVPELLVGAHIKPDAEGGSASVRNGICMSSLHHGAFDSHLIGVAPDYRIHIARPLRDRADGPVLTALQGLDRGRLHLPRSRADWPDPTLLEERFARFEDAQP